MKAKKPNLCQEYKAARKLRGSQTAVARALGVGQITLSRRETGISQVTKEAMMALLSLPEKKGKPC